MNTQWRPAASACMTKTSHWFSGRKTSLYHYWESLLFIYLFIYLSTLNVITALQRGVGLQIHEGSLE